MDLVSECPLRVASLLWQPRAGAFALTVVCKATYVLAEGVARLAPLQEEPFLRDRYRTDDARGGLACASDLAPFKRRADVLLIGRAPAPAGRSAPSFVARLVVAGVDKAVAVQGARLLAGFGPIAPTSPERAGKLHHHAAGWDHHRWNELPLPDDIDAGYFNAAPPDQQVEEIPADARLLLENLHPGQPRLSTHLEALSPRAQVEAHGEPAYALRMRKDTLTIDIDRGRVSLVWRGCVPLLHAAQPGRVVVTLDGRGQGVAPSAAPSGVVLTAEIDVPRALGQAALPFQEGDARGVGTVRPIALPSVVVAPAKLGGTTDIDPAMVRRAGVLPFAQGASAPLPPVEQVLPLATYPIERCASIAASIARRKADKLAILERHELAPELWAELDRHWTEAIQRDAQRGKSSLLRAYDEAYVAQLEAERGPISVEEYARLTVAAERGVEPQTLAELDVPRGAVLRLRRIWLEKTAESPALARRVREAIEGA